VVADDVTNRSTSRRHGGILMAIGFLIALGAGIGSVVVLARLFAPGAPLSAPNAGIFNGMSKVFVQGILPIFIGILIFLYGRGLYSPAKSLVHEASVLDTGSVGLLTWFFGGLLMAAGVLIMLTAGVCSFAVLADVVMTANAAQTVLGMIPVVLSVGGTCIGIGAGLFFAARALYRSTWK
jgi:hypothetical protein